MPRVHYPLGSVAECRAALHRVRSRGRPYPRVRSSSARSRSRRSRSSPSCSRLCAAATGTASIPPLSRIHSMWNRVQRLQQVDTVRHPQDSSDFIPRCGVSDAQTHCAHDLDLKTPGSALNTVLLWQGAGVHGFPQGEQRRVPHRAEADEEVRREDSRLSVRTFEDWT